MIWQKFYFSIDSIIIDQAISFIIESESFVSEGLLPLMQQGLSLVSSICIPTYHVSYNNN